MKETAAQRERRLVSQRRYDKRRGKRRGHGPNVRNSRPRDKEAKCAQEVANVVEDMLSALENEQWMTRYHSERRVREADPVRDLGLLVVMHQRKRGLEYDNTLLGCSFKELCRYLEARFQPGMTWRNRGEMGKREFGTCGWEVDHIRPLASFDLGNVEHRRLAFHYTNLQPLWQHQNRSKGGVG